MFPSRSGDEAHIGPTATYDEVICPGFPTLYHNIIDTRIQHLIQTSYICLKYNITAEDICLSTDYNQMPSGKRKSSIPITTRVQALRRDPPNESSSSLRVKRRSPYLLSIKSPENSLGVVS